VAIGRAHCRVVLFPFPSPAPHRVCSAPDHRPARRHRATPAPHQRAAPELATSSPAPHQRAAPVNVRRRGTTTSMSPWPPNDPQLSTLVSGMVESTTTSGSSPPADQIRRPAAVRRWKKGSSLAPALGLKGQVGQEILAGLA
jgi:hypothetical protein